MFSFLNAPLFLPTVFWIFGLIVGNYISPNPLSFAVFSLLSLLLMFFRKIKFIALFAAIFFLAVFRISLSEITPANSIHNIISQNHHLIQPLHGGIISEVTEKKGVYHCVVRVDSITSKKVGGKILFSSRQKNLHYGDVISTVVDLKKIENSSNPASFDYAEYLKAKRIFASAYSKTLVKIVARRKNFFSALIIQIRKFLQKRIERRFGKYAGFVKAILIGDKSSLGEKRNLLTKAGLSHLLAVSGLHVGILSLIFFFLLKSFVPNRNLARLFLIFILIFYGAICQWSPSVSRAVIMISLYLIARNLQRQPSSNNILAVSLLIITSIRPSQIFSVGLQLSFIAVFVLLNIVPRFSFLKLKKDEIAILGFWKKLVNSLLVIFVSSFILNLFMFPVISFHFHQLNFNGLVGNLFGIPLMTLILPLTLLIVLLPDWNFLVSIYLSGFKFLMLLFGSWVNFASRLPMFNNFYYLNLLQVIFVFLILGFIFFGIRNYKKIKFVLPVIGILILSLFLLGNKKRNNLKITFFDCGLGDLFLVETPSHKTIIIDSGPPDDTRKPFEKSALPYLQKNGISTVDWVIITHAHNDHYGGLDEIFKNLQVKNLVITDEFQQRRIWKHFLPEISDEKCKVVTVSDTTHLEFPLIKLKILHPDKSFSARKINNYSIVTRIDFDNFSILFTGDLEKGGEKYLLQNYLECLDCDVLKIGHHGSKTSSSQDFIDAVSPNFAFIPAPKKNRFNFPHLQTLKKFSYLGNRLFIEGEDGALQIETDGKTAHFHSFLSHRDFSVYDLRD